MMRTISCFATLTLLFFGWPFAASGQNNAPVSPVPPQHARQEPCWRQAGIDRSVMEQRRATERDAHSRIDAVCENSSLTPQQKQQQTREIHREARQKMDALLTPGQLKELQSCQQARGGGRSEEGRHGGGVGPCPHFQSSQPATPSGKAGGSNPQPAENNSSPQK